MKIPKQELKNGVELCFKNANSLIESAKILIEHGDYGHSRFLSLSAIEEISKTFTYALKNIDVEENDEISREIFSHKSKFSIFVFFLFADAVHKSREKGNMTIDKPLDITDFDILEKNVASAIDDLKTGREESLYIDYKRGKWMSPLDIRREEAEAWIEIAQGKKTEIEPLCKSMVAVPLETAKEVNEYMDKMRLSMRDQLYKNIDALYADNVITKKLYEKILNSKANQNTVNKS
jgi:AbiV family abortive infection protein